MNRIRVPVSAASRVAIAFALAGAGALLALFAGCSSASFSPRVELPEVTLQWPFPPNPAKLTYVRSLTGFTPRASAGRSLRALAVGKESADLNAFVLPVAVAVAPDGRMAVADMGRRCVHLYLPEPGKAGSNPDPGNPGRSAEESGRYVRLTGSPEEPIVSPIALAFDDASQALSDRFFGQGVRFRRAGRAALGQPRGRRRRPGSAPPASPTVHERRLLYVVDTLAHRVFGLHTDGTLELSFGGRGEEAGELQFPDPHLPSASAGAGELFVTDTLNFRISSFDEQRPAARRLRPPRRRLGRPGDAEGAGRRPRRRASTSSTASSTTSSCSTARGASCSPSAGGAAHFGEFWLPSGVFVSANGELYVCDTYNRRVQVFRIRRVMSPAVLTGARRRVALVLLASRPGGLFGPARPLPRPERRRTCSNTKHNLVGHRARGRSARSGETRICVFCHTPHNATPESPLWNRELEPQIYTVYASPTLRAGALPQPFGPTKLCLTCHDGTIAMGAVLNPAGRHPDERQRHTARRKPLRLRPRPLGAPSGVVLLQRLAAQPRARSRRLPRTSSSAAPTRCTARPVTIRTTTSSAGSWSRTTATRRSASPATR